MLVSTVDLLENARDAGYAVGAFNVYNLEGALAVVAAAEATQSPAMLQMLPNAQKQGGPALTALCIAAARDASVPMAVQLDHSASADEIRAALDAGISSVMADGSTLPYDENVAFTREMVAAAHAREAAVEGELGRLSGTEDGLTVPEYEARLTDPEQAADFVERTGVDALAVCIGNVHGSYRGEADFDFDRLAAIADAVSLPLVLHGASGVPETLVTRAIELGVCKFNVNTEVRMAYLHTLEEEIASGELPVLLELMAKVTDAMQAVVAEKLRLFGAAGKV